MESLKVKNNLLDENYFDSKLSIKSPFATLDGDFKSPKWAKILLIYKYSHNEIGKCIRFFNKQKYHE
jgi:hypothetical protein